MDYTSLIKEVNIPELVKALRERARREEEWYEHGGDLISDAAAAIEELDAEETRLLLLTSELQDKLIDAQAEVTELKRVNVELFEDLPKYVDKILHWVSVNERLPEPNVQCLVRDNDNNCAVGYYRQDVKAWDSPFFGWLERDDEYYEDGDLCRIGKVVAWIPIEPTREV